VAGVVLADFDLSMLGARSKQCDNSFVKNGLVDSAFCGDLLPTGVVNITVGPQSKLCRAVACAYRAMGCKEETLRVENTIKAGGGVVGTACAADFGLDGDVCDTAGKIVYNTNLPDFSNPKSIAASLSLCSPLITLAITAFPAYAMYADKVGPCGAFCRDAACGLNILCAKQAAPTIKFLAMQTCANASVLSCASFANDMSGTDLTDAPTQSTTTPEATSGTRTRTRDSSSTGSLPTDWATGDSTTSANSHSSDGSLDASAIADMCEKASKTSCQNCTLAHPQCVYCASRRTCMPMPAGGGWFGPSTDMKTNLAPLDTDVCGDWQYKQCWLEGRFVIYIGAGAVALVVCCCCVCISVCICCACRSGKRRRTGYRVQVDDEADDVALLNGASSRE